MFASRLALLGLLVAPAGCGLLGSLPGGECKALETGNFASLEVQGGAEVKGKIVAFMEAAAKLDELAVDIEIQLIGSCGELGYAIGLPAAEMKKEPNGGEGAKEVCGAVAAEIDAILEANAEAKLELSVAPPQCYANVELITQCLAGCGAAVEPGKLEASCEGGEIAGSCTGECQGSCRAEGSVKCEGTCEGKCNGTCNGEDVSGSCDGTCEGSCEGTCKLSGSASCQGTCTGSCDVEMKAPKCTGTFEPPNVDASCHAQCTAKAAAVPRCDPPRVFVEVDGKADAKLGKLVAGLRAKLPGIVKVQLGTAKQLKGTAEAVVSAGGELPSIVGEAGFQALSCVGAAIDMAASASGSVSVSVEASASVSGSAGAG